MAASTVTRQDVIVTQRQRSGHHALELGELNWGKMSISLIGNNSLRRFA